MENFTLPTTDRPLIVEGAGGVLVPMNDELVMFDLVDYLQLPTIVVVRNYLGSINHTLLSIEALKQRNIPIEGIIFCGDPNLETADVTVLPILVPIPAIIYCL